MRLRNGERGYGAITKLLHWLTVTAIAAQFFVGYTMEADGDAPEVDCDPPGEDRSGGDLSDAEKDRLDQLEEECEAAQELAQEEAEDAVGTAWSDLLSGDLAEGGLTLPELHVLLGVTILALGVLRVVWRRATPLPPWDPRLTARDQRLVSATESTLLTLQFVVPGSGLLLVIGGDDLLGVHIAAHIAFFVALAAHLAMVLGKGLLPRMLPGGTGRRADE